MNIYHTQLANMSLDEILDLTAGVYFFFYNMYLLVWQKNRKFDSLSIIM